MSLCILFYYVYRREFTIERKKERKKNGEEGVYIKGRKEIILIKIYHPEIMKIKTFYSYLLRIRAVASHSTPFFFFFFCSKLITVRELISQLRLGLWNLFKFSTSLFKTFKAERITQALLLTDLVRDCDEIGRLIFWGNARNIIDDTFTDKNNLKLSKKGFFSLLLF